MKIFAKGIGLVLLAVCAAGGAENAAKAKYQALVQRAQSGDRTVAQRTIQMQVKFNLWNCGQAYMMTHAVTSLPYAARLEL